MVDWRRFASISLIQPSLSAVVLVVVAPPDAQSLDPEMAKLLQRSLEHPNPSAELEALIKKELGREKP
jgi:hypothetical protein